MNSANQNIYAKAWIIYYKQIYYKQIQTPTQGGAPNNGLPVKLDGLEVYMYYKPVSTCVVSALLCERKAT